MQDTVNFGTKHIPMRSLCLAAVSIIALSIAAPASAQDSAQNKNSRLTDKLRQISAEASGEVALYYKNLSTGFTWELNAKTPYPAASIIKIPVVVTLYTLLDIGERQSNQALRVTRRDRVGGTGVLQGRKTPFKLSLQDAVELALNKSDNIAANVLIDFVSMKAVNHRMERMGYPSIQLNRKMVHKAPPENWMNAHEMGLLLEKVAQDMILIPEGFESLLNILKKAPRGNKLGGLLPEGTQIARKGGRLMRHIHDAAILTARGQTVVIVAMVSAFKNRKKATRALHLTGKTIYDALLKSGGRPAKPN
jgi:beta-lactamase class A